MDDAAILAALRNALFNFAAGNGNQSYTIAGRSFVRADVMKIQELIELYEARVAAASSGSIGGGGVEVRLNDPCGFGLGGIGGGFF